MDDGVMLEQMTWLTFAELSARQSVDGQCRCPACSTHASSMVSPGALSIVHIDRLIPVTCLTPTSAAALAVKTDAIDETVLRKRADSFQGIEWSPLIPIWIETFMLDVDLRQPMRLERRERTKTTPSSGTHYDVTNKHQR